MAERERNPEWSKKKKHTNREDHLARPKDMRNPVRGGLQNLFKLIEGLLSKTGTELAKR